MKTYNRYSQFINNGKMSFVPFIQIPNKPSDMYEQYILGRTRLDLLSYKYYKNPNYDWLILQANPECGSLEFNITDGTILRIPYPLDITLQQYMSDVNTHKKLYELN